MVLFNFINSSLRVAETVWMEGVFLKDYPPEAFTIKCLEVTILETWPPPPYPTHPPTTFYFKDSLALLATEGGLQRFEKHLKSWMKKIQANLGRD